MAEPRIFPHAQDASGDRLPVYGYNLGQSFIWLTHTRFNVMLETMFTSSQAVVASNRTQWTNSIFLSPGVRWSYNFRNGLQIVPGVGVPIGVGPSAGERPSFCILVSSIRSASCRSSEIRKRPASKVSETHEHRLRLELNAPEFFHALLNMVFQRQNVRSRGFSAVHDGQGVFARDSDSSAAIASAETRVLNQPARLKLSSANRARDNWESASPLRLLSWPGRDIDRR